MGAKYLIVILLTASPCYLTDCLNLAVSKITCETTDSGGLTDCETSDSYKNECHAVKAAIFFYYLT